MTFREFMKENGNEVKKNNVLGRFFASRAIWPFGYSVHVQSCFQRVERRLRISNRTGIGA